MLTVCPKNHVILFNGASSFDKTAFNAEQARQYDRLLLKLCEGEPERIKLDS